MICGVPVAAMANPHSLWRPDAGLPELLLDPVELLADPIDWLSNTEFGLVGELGLEDPVVPAEPADCVALEFEGPNTVLGFAGELGLGGTAGLSPGLIPVLEVLSLNSDLRANSDLWAPKGCLLRRPIGRHRCLRFL